jgi:16S rRNA (cytosine967-C5)-methyltransferase
MKAFEHSRDILLEIIEGKQSFSAAVRAVFSRSAVEFSIQSLVRSLTSCELHHHLLLQYAVTKRFSNLTSSDRLMLQVVLGNVIFIKRIPYEESITFMKRHLLELGVAETDIDDFLLQTQPGQQLIGEEISTKSVEYLSLKFNTPLWLVNMWQKHFGVPNTYKILKANNQAVLQACRVNDFKATVESIVEDDSYFIKGPIPHTVIYQGKEPLKHRPAFAENHLFQQRLAVTDILNKFDFSTMFGDVLIVETRPNALYLEIPIATNNKNKIQVATNSIARKLDIQKAIVNFELSNIMVYESTPKLLISHVSHPQDFVIVVSNCSKFDLIRSLPDFFIHFDQDQIDGLIAEQKETMLEASQFVAEGGLFAYAVNTLNKKEAQYLVAAFLEEHPDFTLVHEKQYFPFDEFNTALYAAILRKKITDK